MELTLDLVKSSEDIKTELVPVPEWAPKGTDPKDAFMRIRVMSGEKRQHWDELRARIQKEDGDDGWITHAASRFAVLVCCKPDLSPLFTESDINWLTHKSSLPLDRIWSRGLRLNGGDAKTIEEMEKNAQASSASGPNSSTDSESQTSASSDASSTPGALPS